MNPGPNDPVDLLVADVLLGNELNEFVQVPVPVSNMLSNDCAVEVNEDVSFRADHPFPLLTRIQLVTVNAFVK